MKIFVVADTHSEPIPDAVLNVFRGVELIVHAGDFCREVDWKIFSKLSEVKAVHGNRDDDDIRRMFPEKMIFSVGNFKIGLTHGSGSGEKVLENVRDVFSRDRLDVVIFGHSHQPFKKWIDGVLYFNPGSLTDRVSAPYRSYGVMSVSASQVTAKIVRLPEDLGNG
jgi:uncharacterized protein